MDPGYAGVYLNAMPTTDMKYEFKENSEEVEELKIALVKCEESDPERLPGVVGYRSGKRSAILLIGDGTTKGPS